MQLLRAPEWSDYELIDCGNFEKLERFGPYTLIRPEPQALWDKRLTDYNWQSMSHARYVAQSSTSGSWEKNKPIRAPWQVSFKTEDFNIRFSLKFTAFKHLGVFPEQAANWIFLHKFLQDIKEDQPRVLNLFAYTGGASLAARAAGADVVHLDSVKQVVSWARENMQLSGLKDIRWVVEDATRFAAREAKRGNKYHAVIMDPPSYGLGPAGERWKLEDHLNELMQHALQMLHPEKHCLIINTYSLNLSSLVLKNIVERIQPAPDIHDYGELCIESSQKQLLPLGSYLRLRKL